MLDLGSSQVVGAFIASQCIEPDPVAVSPIFPIPNVPYQGNTTSHKHETPGGTEHEHYARHASPPLSPGSPLTYSPQIPMEPIARADELTAANRNAPEFHGVAGWPAQPKLMPVVIVCK